VIPRLNKAGSGPVRRLHGTELGTVGVNTLQTSAMYTAAIA
jgi:hypothetical protein